MTTAIQTAPQSGKYLSLTFDDGPLLDDTPHLCAAGRNAALLAALDKHDVRSTLFVTLGNGANTEAGHALARAWHRHGHLIGNHTAQHLNLNQPATTLPDFQQDLMACEHGLNTLLTHPRYFRFPYLKEGDSAEKRSGMRTFLQARGYFNARVSADTSDWRLDQHLVKRLKQHPASDTGHYRRVYLSHIRQRIQAWQALSLQLFQRVIPMVMLLHYNLINALFLDDVLQMLKLDGWRFIGLPTAYLDPVYHHEPDQLLHGQSLLLSIARQQACWSPQLERLTDNGATETDELDRWYGT